MKLGIGAVYPNAIGWAVLAVGVVLAPGFGSASSVIAVLLSFGLLPLVFGPGNLRVLLQAPAQMAFVAVFVVLSLAFVVTARAPGDMLFFANFLALPFSGLLYLWARSAFGPRTLAVVAACCLAGAAVAAGFAIYDVYVSGLRRATGIIGNPNLISRTALTLGFIALAGTMLAPSRHRWLFYLAPLLALVVTYLSGSRGAALAVPGMAAVAALFLWRDRTGRVLVLASLGAVLLAATALTVMDGWGGLARFAGIAETIGESLFNDGAGVDSATSQRLDMYRAGVAAFLQSPWLGWGWAHLGTAAAAADPANFARAAGTNFMFHSDIINFAVAAGVVGVLALAALLAAPIVGALAAPRDELFAARLYCCVQLSLGYAVFGLTDMTLGYDLPTTLYAFLTALILGAVRDRPSP